MTARFCAECGWVIGQRRPPGSALVDSKERKFVTVLFADIQGSTEVAGGLDPEDWFLALERFHGAATASIRGFGGVVTLYAGDGVMALFGAPIAHENHAAQACWAALRLTEQMRTIARDLAPTLGAQLGVRVGLNSGMVVVGGIGDEARIDYTAQGLPVHIAARMEQIGEVGEIFVAPSTTALVAERFELERVGERAVKGIAEPIVVHRLVGPRLLAAGGAPVLHTAPFVGREAEVAILQAALADARAGCPPIVGITAPAGYGKSRLVAEYLSERKRRGTDVVALAGDVVRVPGPMSGVVELARGLLNLESDTVGAALTRLDPAHEWAPSLVAVLTSVGEPVPVEGLTAQTQFDASLRRLVDARAERADDALVIVVDDVHALDRASQSRLASVFATPFRTPTLFVVTSRTRAELARVLPHNALLIDLESLRLDETERVVQEWLVERDEAREVARCLHERNGGNPFFVYETLRSLVEAGRLVGPFGRRRLRGPLDEMTVPARVQLVIAAGIDRLDRDQREVLYSAAVIGVEFDETTLVAAADLDPLEATRLLDDLVTANLVRVLGGGRFAFRHRIIQEVAYDTQSRDQRRRSHARVAVALEGRDDAERHAAVVAVHHQRAGNLDAAANWSERAAQHP